MEKLPHHHLENQFLKVIIKNTGAGLGSIFNKKNNEELLWQGNPSYWTGQAPILFPIVGELKEGFYTHKNQQYEIPRHGLVRKSDRWQFNKIDNTKIECLFVSNSVTKERYPFDFEFKVTYTLSGKSLKVSHDVSNLGSETMPCSIGGHPAFNTPISETISCKDYTLEFETSENSARHFLNEKGLLNGETELVLKDSTRLQLTEELFNNDALVFKDLKSRSVDLVGPNGPILKVSYPGFSSLGIWAKPAAPFVCIEPWIGHADIINSTHNLFDKEGSVHLEAKQNFTASYKIEVC